MRVVFMGTPAFAVPTLAALIEAGHEVACVYCQPPRPAGRGHKERPSAVHAYALAHRLTVRTPRSLKDGETQQAFAGLGADVGVVAAYGLILPRPVLEAPRFGCLNVHASRLPRWRGAAPIQRAILAGDTTTAVTIMQMDEGLDTGPMLLVEEVAIGPSTTGGELHDKLAAVGARLIVETLAGLEGGSLKPTPQPAAGVAYAHKLARDEERLDWTKSAMELERAVRAFSPVPGAWCELAGERLKVLAAELVRTDDRVAPGTTLDALLTVACGEGALRLTQIQRAGRAPMAAEVFLRGHPVPAGTRLG